MGVDRTVVAFEGAGLEQYIRKKLVGSSSVTCLPRRSSLILILLHFFIQKNRKPSNTDNEPFNIKVERFQFAHVVEKQENNNSINKCL